MYNHIILSIITVFLSVFTESKRFLDEYKAHVMENIDKKPVISQERISVSVECLDKAIEKFQTEQNRPFFISDTVYIIDFNAIQDFHTALLIWNKSNSCYYQATVLRKEIKDLSIETNAKERIAGLNNSVKKIILNADTIAFNQFITKNRIFDGAEISFTRAIKTKGHWQFLSSRSASIQIYE